MNKYNKPFFSLLENIFIVLSSRFDDEKQLLNCFREIMCRGLKSSYGCKFKRGFTSEFVRLVGERDKLVGLDVRFLRISENKIIYQLYSDPMPNLKGYITCEQLDSCYLDFKVNYILGKNWQYKTTRHLWRGDECSEHIIEKIA